jgi:CheY-like chemotaxis protein
MNQQSILIVDDNPTNLMILEELVHLVGFANTQSESDPRVALDIIKTRYYDILLIDQNMPHITGLEFLKQLHASGAKAPKLAIMITAVHDERLRSEAIEAGFTTLLPKPYQLSQLRDVLISID